MVSSLPRENCSRQGSVGVKALRQESAFCVQEKWVRQDSQNSGQGKGGRKSGERCQQGLKTCTIF